MLFDYQVLQYKKRVGELEEEGKQQKAKVHHVTSHMTCLHDNSHQSDFDVFCFNTVLMIVLCVLNVWVNLEPGEFCDNSRKYIVNFCFRFDQSFLCWSSASLA